MTGPAAGFRKQRTLYKLVFTDEEYDGLIIRMFAPPLDEFLKLASMDVGALGQKKAVTAADLDQMSQLFEFFARYLAAWNLEHQDHPRDAAGAIACDEIEGCGCAWVPTPPTVEGLQRQELPFILMIVESWVDAVAQVPAGKGPPSNDGSPPVPPPLEESIPMAAVS